MRVHADCEQFCSSGFTKLVALFLLSGIFSFLNVATKYLAAHGIWTVCYPAMNLTFVTLAHLERSQLTSVMLTASIHWEKSSQDKFCVLVNSAINATGHSTSKRRLSLDCVAPQWETKTDRHCMHLFLIDTNIIFLNMAMLVLWGEGGNI